MRFLDYLGLCWLLSDYQEDDQESFDFPDPVSFSSVCPIGRVYCNADEARLMCDKLSRKGCNCYIQPVYFNNCDTLFFCIVERA